MPLECHGEQNDKAFPNAPDKLPRINPQDKKGQTKQRTTTEMARADRRANQHTKRQDKQHTTKTTKRHEKQGRRKKQTKNKGGVRGQTKEQPKETTTAEAKRPKGFGGLS